MDFLPIFLDVRDKTVLVDGGTTVAARRAERALDAGANVVICDPAPEDEVRLLMEERGNITFLSRVATRQDVSGCAVVYGTSENDERDTNLYAWAQEERVLCNIADVNDKCDFITPSIVDRSPVVVAISTGGAAPVIARTLRARIEAALPISFGKLAELTGQLRERISNALPDGRTRRHFWERMIDGPVGDLFLSGKHDDAIRQFDRDLDEWSAGKSNDSGEVYLVGAGPGNPDLLTFQALRLMQRADVVLYDRLIGNDILSLIRREAKRIYVGKLPQDHTMAQEDISSLMVRLAKEGNRVLRLKGGDPFIFGRGGEEIETLNEAGVPFQVVPGITAAAGCGAYAGIPLTHRDHAQACLFVTAHGRDGVLELDWDRLIRPAQTVAIYMGLSNLPTLVEGFEKHGVDLSTRVAVVEKGTRPDQRVLTGRLSDIAGKVVAEGFESPSMIIVGSVVELHDTLKWRQEVDEHRMSLTPDQNEVI